MSEKKKKKKDTSQDLPNIFHTPLQIKKFAGKLFYNNHSVMAFPVL